MDVGWCRLDNFSMFWLSKKYKQKEQIMKNTQKIRGLILITIAVILLAACKPQDKTLTGAEQEAVLGFSEAKTDNLLAGMDQNDYAVFSKDFDAAMLKAMTNDQFTTMKQDRDSKLGGYVSRQVNSVVQSGDFYVVIYDAKFEKEDQVTLRVVFQVAEPHSISGLWFSK
jgi:hypothetical protein